jgi:hypothetical protein
MEPLVDRQIAYPFYHMMSDTLGWLDLGQTERIAAVAAGFIDDLAAAPAEIAMRASDMLPMYRGRPTTRRTFQAGDSIAVWIRVRNIGAADPPAGATVHIKLSHETARGAAPMLSSDVTVPGALDATGVIVPISLGSGEWGENIVRAEILVAGMNDDWRNNAGAVRFAVEGAGAAVLRHSVQPNPVRGALREATFCMNLAREIDARLEIYTIEGERIGTALMSERYGSPLQPGLCCVPLGSLFPELESVVSGVYLYRLIAYEGSIQTKLYGRFAVER